MDYIVKKLTIADTNSIVNHLCGLADEDRRLRFGVASSEYSIRSYVEGSFGLSSVWFGIDDENGDLISACHVAVEEDFAELGCSVDSRFRGFGLAQLMFSRAITWLRTKSIKTVFMHCLSENVVMRHIAEKNDMVVVSCSSGELDVEVDIKPPTAVTFMEDAYLDRIAFYDMITKNSLRMFKLFAGDRNT